MQPTSKPAPDSDRAVVLLLFCTIQFDWYGTLQQTVFLPAI